MTKKEVESAPVNTDAFRVCQNCASSGFRTKKGVRVTKCLVTGRVVPPDMSGCYLWRHKHGQG